VGRMHHWEELGVLWCISLLTFAIGLFVYRRLRPAFADVV
jgi:lipopolysaccharide transport system permease protein